jgi:hypothetical protein
LRLASRLITKFSFRAILILIDDVLIFSNNYILNMLVYVCYFRCLNPASATGSFQRIFAQRYVKHNMNHSGGSCTTLLCISMQIISSHFCTNRPINVGPSSLFRVPRVHFTAQYREYIQLQFMFYKSVLVSLSVSQSRASLSSSRTVCGFRTSSKLYSSSAC